MPLFFPLFFSGRGYHAFPITSTFEYCVTLLPTNRRKRWTYTVHVCELSNGLCHRLSQFLSGFYRVLEPVFAIFVPKIPTILP